MASLDWVYWKDDGRIREGVRLVDMDVLLPKGIRLYKARRGRE